MLRYVGARLVMAVPVLLGVTILVFSMLYLLPGDPVQAMLGESATSAEHVERLRRELGLDDPIYVQYARFLGNALRGDLGRSLVSRHQVLDEILSQFPATAELALASMAIAVIVGVTLGVLAAIRQNSWLDTLSMFVALLGVSMPGFWLGLMLIFFFSLRLGWFPATGQGGPERLILPATALGIGAAAIIARLTRSSMVEVLRQEYVTTARAKGLAEHVVILRHALQNALIPVVTMVGLQFGYLLAGAVIIETVFARQGIGRLIITSILAKDFPLVQGAVLFTACLYVLVNLLVDISYAVLDPRIRYGAK
ncbi:MAG: ABC transporter permease [Chloroflexi bacterium]|nr:ABC transporter permease [Chloroflexota bacterium]MCL5108677.1 ABC transporter permease [Chloroflexota bacterium]